MRFALASFFQDGAYRVFSFDTLPRGEGQGRYWVKADLNLARRYGISLQELPLLCRSELETDVCSRDEHTIIYTAEKMMQHAAKRAAVAAARPRRNFPPRRQTAT